MADTSKEVVLKVAGISKRFGGLQALSDVGITIQRGQVYGLIGPNGAGKTTFFNVITGLYTPDAGSFELAGQPYEPRSVHLVAKAGIARTFQNIRLFAEMTALENVMVGRHVRTQSGVILGAVLLSALPEVLRYVAGPLQAMTDGRLDSAILRQLLIALAMIIIMLMRPRGLWPSPEHGKSLTQKT